MNDLSDNLRLLRKAQHLSQTQLADRIGITQEFMSELESAKKKPSIQVLEKLCDALDCSADFLLGIEPDKGPSMMKEEYVQGKLKSGGISFQMLEEMCDSGVNDNEMRLALKLAKVMKTNAKK